MMLDGGGMCMFQHNGGVENVVNDTGASYYAEEHPLRAAASALQNLAEGGEEGHQSALNSYYQQVAAAVKNSSGQSVGSGPQGQTSSEPEDLSCSNGGSLGKRPSDASVVRLAMPKMEYPVSHSTAHQVEVIKATPTATTSPRGELGQIDHHHHHHHQLHHHPHGSNSAVLTEMVNMAPQIGAYDPVSYRVPAIYNKMSSVYDNVASQPYLPATLPSLPAAYSMLTAPSSQEYYIQSAAATATRPPDYYAQHIRHYAEAPEELIDRLSRGQSVYSRPMTVELPSPVDSGIGQDLIITPKQEIGLDGQVFTYNDLHRSIVQEMNASRMKPSDYMHQSTPTRALQASTGASVVANDRHVIAATRESPIHIPKIITSIGFQYTLEAPISTSVRREDDRMTYINKGQFYTVTLEYIPDHQKPLKSQTVRSVLMAVFREDKSAEEELKCWQFWHSRQHSAKQRILDVDTKNSSGVTGAVEEIAHNAVQIYWNTNEQPVKVNVAVQCLSTDFSNQKGVKGLPLHLQIDTFDELSSTKTPFHRGYCQIKVFCDKGANRKMLHENRREEKRRIQGRKKSDGEFHESCERSEFYHMSNLHKPAVLFVPPEDYDRFPPLDSFYAPDPLSLKGASSDLNSNHPSPHEDDDDSTSPHPKRPKMFPNDRIMIYVRRPDQQHYIPLHVAPPNLEGLAKAITEKFNIEPHRLMAIYKDCRKRVRVQMDDEMICHYCNEDCFLLTFEPTSIVGAEETAVSAVLTELDLSGLLNEVSVGSLVEQHEQQLQQQHASLERAAVNCCSDESSSVVTSATGRTASPSGVLMSGGGAR